VVKSSAITEPSRRMNYELVPGERAGCYFVTCQSEGVGQYRVLDEHWETLACCTSYEAMRAAGRLLGIDYYLRLRKDVGDGSDGLDGAGAGGDGAVRAEGREACAVSDFRIEREEADTDPFEIGVKRFYVPGVVARWTCEACGKECSYNFGVYYLAYPTANAPFEETFNCACGREVKQCLRLTLSLSVETGGEKVESDV
jgi:hypothetical protein